MDCKQRHRPIPAECAGQKRVSQPKRETAMVGPRARTVRAASAAERRGGVRPTKRVPRSPKISALGSGARSKKAGSRAGQSADLSARASPRARQPTSIRPAGPGSSPGLRSARVSRSCASTSRRPSKREVVAALDSAGACATGCRPGPERRALRRRKTSLFQYHHDPLLAGSSAAAAEGFGRAEEVSGHRPCRNISICSAFFTIYINFIRRIRHDNITSNNLALSDVSSP